MPPVCQVRMKLPSFASEDSDSSRRTRINSYNSGNKRPHYLSLITGVRSKFTSLPNVLTGSFDGKNTVRKISSIRWQFPFERRQGPEVMNLDPVGRLDVPKQELNTDEEASLCPSATSRKDSGIKSASRRSSIQQQVSFYNIFLIQNF